MSVSVLSPVSVREKRGEEPHFCMQGMFGFDSLILENMLTHCVCVGRGVLIKKGGGLYRRREAKV